MILDYWVTSCQPSLLQHTRLTYFHQALSQVFTCIVVSSICDSLNLISLYTAIWVVILYYYTFDYYNFLFFLLLSQLLLFLWFVLIGDVQDFSILSISLNQWYNLVEMPFGRAWWRRDEPEPLLVFLVNSISNQHVNWNSYSIPEGNSICRVKPRKHICNINLLANIFLLYEKIDGWPKGGLYFLKLQTNRLLVN